MYVYVFMYVYVRMGVYMYAGVRMYVKIAKWKLCRNFFSVHRLRIKTIKNKKKKKRMC